MTDHANPDLQAKRRASLARIQKLAYWLDDAFRVPIIGKRVGIDGIIGMVPFAGDFAGLALSSLMIGEAVRLGAPKRLLVRMGANVGVDFVIGLVPVAGDLFDMAYKANRRNQALVQRWLEEVTGESKGSRGKESVAILLGVAAALVVCVGLWRAVFG
ncbi:DUF4112 domain-containing protein [Salinisphaera hydrothermalis]|uniref:DUF4112 domain-containing protein n=1 Tax=Salinisphaera hydrothermalis (strain C41B8) TaxID=1304275 RepID=A0A084IL96_SALHC|nr:DUF4112 domain-containing protein [Salinisphaera hydrothermalis]KEZ77480.1 hypothetical protein C41B8_09776 [Salinisphaera hydrothermalis C41B8]